MGEVETPTGESEGTNPTPAGRRVAGSADVGTSREALLPTSRDEHPAVWEVLPTAAVIGPLRR